MSAGTNSLCTGLTKLVNLSQAKSGTQLLDGVLDAMSRQYGNSEISVFVRKYKKLHLLNTTLRSSSLKQGLERGFLKCLKENDCFTSTTILRKGVSQSMIYCHNCDSSERIYLIVEATSGNQISFPQNDAIYSAYVFLLIENYLKDEKIKSMLNTDATTGLLNRDAFIKDLHTYTSCMDGNQNHCLGVIALINCDEMQQEYGYREFDRLVKEGASFLAGLKQAYYRTGEARFACIYPHDIDSSNQFMLSVFDRLKAINSRLVWSAVIVPLDKDVYKSLYLGEHFLKHSKESMITILRNDVVENEWNDAGYGFKETSTIITDSADVIDVPFREIITEDSVVVREKKSRSKKTSSPVRQVNVPICVMEDFFTMEAPL